LPVLYDLAYKIPSYIEALFAVEDDVVDEDIIVLGYCISFFNTGKPEHCQLHHKEK